MGGVEMVGGTMGAKGEEFLRPRGSLEARGESKRKEDRQVFASQVGLLCPDITACHCWANFCF